MSALLELHLIAMFISERIVNPKLSIPVLGSVNGNLCLFRLARTSRGDDFVDGSGHGGTWRLWSSRRVEIQYRDSCGSRHAGLRHFRPDAGRCSVAGCVPSVLMPHAAMMTSRWSPRLSHFARWRNMRWIPVGRIMFGSARARVEFKANGPIDLGSDVVEHRARARRPRRTRGSGRAARLRRAHRWRE